MFLNNLLRSVAEHEMTNVTTEQQVLATLAPLQNSFTGLYMVNTAF
jgi:hypothetical protein